MSDETTAAGALDLIREGGVMIVTVALSRLEEAQRLIQEGRFDTAVTRIQEAEGHVSSLAGAQQTLGAYGKNVTLVRAREVQEGIRLCHMGQVVDVEVQQVPTPSSYDKHEIVTIRTDATEEPMQFHGDKQLLAWVD